MVVVAAFDLGIKNLCYCVASFDPPAVSPEILQWKNMSLLAEGASSQSQTRCVCGGPASFSFRSEEDEEGSQRLLCKKCVKHSEVPVFAATSTKVAELREFVAALDSLDPKSLKRATKEELLARIAECHLMPYKAPKIKGFDIKALLRQMEICLTAELPHLVAADLIRIENQPCDFGQSRMQTVQTMLFTLLDHRLRTEYGWAGTIEFASASVKTRGTTAKTGAAGKRSRKLAAIERANTLLLLAPSVTVKEWHTWWRSQSKQDDLADSLLMCVDAVIPVSPS
jgi:hypothetical protein